MECCKPVMSFQDFLAWRKRNLTRRDNGTHISNEQQSNEKSPPTPTPPPSPGVLFQIQRPYSQLKGFQRSNNSLHRQRTYVEVAKRYLLPGHPYCELLLRTQSLPSELFYTIHEYIQAIELEEAEEGLRAEARRQGVGDTEALEAAVGAVRLGILRVYGNTEEDVHVRYSMLEPERKSFALGDRDAGKEKKPRRKWWRFSTWF